MSFRALIAAACLFAISSITFGAAATTQRRLADQAAHLQSIEQKLKTQTGVLRASDPYMRLDLTVAQRFIDRIRANRGKDDASAKWRALQLDEIGQVLSDADNLLLPVDGRKPDSSSGGFVPWPTGGPVKIDDGVLVTSVRDGAGRLRTRPYYFGGFGHFQQVINDLPNFRALGVSIIQDSRNGPAQGLNPDFTLTVAGRGIRDALIEANKAGVKVDLLTSPHYFPAWAVDKNPDMANGTPFNNIDHPAERKAIESWLTQIGKLVNGQPALMSCCLSNEPVYGASGRDKYSAPAWHQFLRAHHKSIDALNALYGTKFASFDAVPADGWKNDSAGQRWAFDWVTFNNQHFAAWHKWMGELLKKDNPDLLTHAKIMVFFSLDPDKAGWGIDPECFADATDLAGCDAYAQLIAGVGPLDESASKEYAYHWQVEEMFYDLLNSFRNQPVFNSENHPMENACGPYPFPAIHTQAVIWQGALHHQCATTDWVWEEDADPSLEGSIYFRPAHVQAMGRTMLDLNRLADQVTAINRAPASVAILYSPASRFWDKNYAVSMRTLYTALTFLGGKVTFISERQLAEHRAAKVRMILFPSATHVTDATIAALDHFTLAGGKLIAAGEKNLAFDEYDRPRKLPASLVNMEQVPVTSEKAAAESIEKLLPARHDGVRLVDAAHHPCWGIEWRVVPFNGKRLIPLMNMIKNPQTVSIDLPGATQGVDLITGRTISLTSINLPPMQPMLVEIDEN